MLRAILNKSRRQHPTKQQLYCHLPPIRKTIKIRRTRYAGHCWRSRDELLSNVLLWTPSHGRAKAGRPARTYMQQLFADTGCSPEDLPEATDDREGWREKVRNIRADSVTWWWWLFWIVNSIQNTINRTSCKMSMKNSLCSNYEFTFLKICFNSKSTVCTGPTNDPQWSYLKKWKNISLMKLPLPPV